MTNRKGAHLALPLSTEIKKTAVWIGAMGLVARPSFLCCLIMFFVFFALPTNETENTSLETRRA